MKHHFGDMLDREGGYWTMAPNVDRFAYTLDRLPAEAGDIAIATIGKHDENWQRILTFANLQEITLHEPSKEQLGAIASLRGLKRLRITHARPNHIEFIGPLADLEELALEYVSGVSDLSPLRPLTRLRALHLENLRRVKDFSGLSGMQGLRYLHIDGTLDWKQPIENFEFLAALPTLEVLSLGQVITQCGFPAFMPAVGLKNLRRIKIPGNMFSTQEYALLQAAMPHVMGTDWKLCEPFYGAFEFLGKGAGRVKCTSPEAFAKCAEFTRRYNAMKEECRKLL